MPGIIVIGLQWGDERKGKAVDLLSSQTSHIVHSQGGIGSSPSLVSSGISHPHAQCYVAGGCFVDPKLLAEELLRLESNGIVLDDRLHLSAHAQVVFQSIKGFTVRLGEFVRPEIFQQKIEEKGLVNSEGVFEEYIGYAQVLRPFVEDTESLIQNALLRDESVLLHGTDGTLLDPVFGSYPYMVTSSTTAAGICSGAGVSPIHIEEVYGVLKAYMTRVGEGPLPTAVDPDTMHEFGSFEGLDEVERRFGWLDLVLTRYTTQLNGVGQLVLTDLDRLDRFEEIKVCVGYHLNGEEIDRPPLIVEDWINVEPIYETFPGWESSTQEVENVRGLPQNARNFIDAIEDFTNIPVSVISVGEAREETIFVDEEWV